VRDAARAHSLLALERLAYWARSRNARASVAAAQALLDRGWGRPGQSIALTDGDGNKLPAPIFNFSFADGGPGASNGAPVATDVHVETNADAEVPRLPSPAVAPAVIPAAVTREAERVRVAAPEPSNEMQTMQTREERILAKLGGERAAREVPAVAEIIETPEQREAADLYEQRAMRGLPQARPGREIENVLMNRWARRGKPWARAEE
jgi:hypothetical protein